MRKIQSEKDEIIKQQTSYVEFEDEGSFLIIAEFS